MSETPEIPAAIEAATPGELLKQARERAGLSIEKVAKDLYLDLQVVRALESNHFKDLGAAVYAKGYLKKYARLLGISEQSVVQGYERLGAIPVADPIPAAMGTVPETRQPLPRWVWWAVIGLLVLAGVVTLLNMRSTDEPQQATVITRPLNAPATPAVADSPLASLPAGGSAAMAGAMSVALKFTADSWVEVRDGENRQVLYEMGTAGLTRQLQVAPPVSVVLGAAKAVTVQVNAADIAVPQKNIRDGVARFVVKADGSVE